MKQSNPGAQRRLSLSALLAVLLVWPAGLVAQEIDEADEFEDAPSWYLGLLGGYVAPDSARDAKQGINLHGILGLMLGESAAVELNVFGTEIERDSDGLSDYFYGGGLDLNLGTPAPGNPFFLVGGGMIHEDLGTATQLGATVVGYKDNAAYANAGLGFYLPFSFFGELWRLEGRYNVVFNDEAIHPGSTVPEELLEDGRLNLGFVFAFGRDEPLVAATSDIDFEPPPPSDPVPPPPVLTDADNDGIADELDQCPGTPRWVRAEANGCIPDSDRDGVDETRDCCPNTPASTAVDGQGCDPAVAPATLLPPPDADEDKDGVMDRVDKCPHTVPGYGVNAAGCINIQDVVVKSIHFELDSDALTPSAYLLLNSVAASFKTQPDAKLEVAGHADGSGSSKYNLELSQQRAAVVRDFLIYSGVPEERLTTVAYGETRPLGDNKTEEGRGRNRRVEFRIQAQ